MIERDEDVADHGKGNPHIGGVHLLEETQEVMVKVSLKAGRRRHYVEYSDANMEAHAVPYVFEAQGSDSPGLTGRIGAPVKEWI